MHVLVLGDVYVENHSGKNGGPVRLGGVFHAARAFWATGTKYTLGIACPSYLFDDIKKYAEQLSCVEVIHISEVKGSPLIITVEDLRETGQQLYDEILYEHRKDNINKQALESLLSDKSYSDMLVFPTKWTSPEVLEQLNRNNAKIHIDIAYDIAEPAILEAAGRPFDTIFCSTSSKLFLDYWEGDCQKMIADLLPSKCSKLVFKENRGGVRTFRDIEELVETRAPAYPRHIVHSVGVGDFFDAIFLERTRNCELKAALHYSSYAASCYASSWDDERIALLTAGTSKIPEETILDLAGLSLPWEVRPRSNLYMAAPDFDYLDREHLDDLVSVLSYHNFTPRLPVREHGQIQKDDGPEKRRDTFRRDLQLISECSMLVAVLLEDDPGTYIEIGIAYATNKPIIIYDPHSIAHNLMLTHVPRKISNDKDEIILEVFKVASKMWEEGAK